MGKGSGVCTDGSVGMGSLLMPEADRGEINEAPWLHEAMYLYTGSGLSLREVGEIVGVSDSTVGRHLKKRGVVLRKRSRIKPIHRSLDIALERQSQATEILAQSLSDIKEQLEAIGETNAQALIDGLSNYGNQQVRSGVHFAIYSDAATFVTEQFAEAFSKGLLDRHIGDGAIVSMFAFERLLAEALSSSGCQGELSSVPNHPGRDLTYNSHEEPWRTSCKSESHKDVSEDDSALRLSYLMKWDPPPEATGKKLAKHLKDYDYIHHLRAVQNVSFPKESGRAGEDACRYNFYQVPKHILEDVSRRKLKPGTNTLVLKSRANPGKTFEVKVELTSEFKVRIPSIPLEEVELLASFWISPPRKESN